MCFYPDRTTLMWKKQLQHTDKSANVKDKHKSIERSDRKEYTVHKAIQSGKMHARTRAHAHIYGTNPFCTVNTTVW